MPKPKYIPPTVELARENLAHDPVTGEFRWRKPSRNRPMDRVPGYRRHDGYWIIALGGRQHYAHRLAWLLAYGVWPTNQIDHINGVRDDNRLANLRDVPRAYNQQNLHRAEKDNRSTGVLGVKKEHRNDTYYARIGVSGKQRHLGTFPTAEEAHQAYLQAKRRLHPGCTL